MKLELESERFPASGGSAADGVLNQLGRPSADGLTMLIREAVQNSWDARCGDEAIRFQAHFYELDGGTKSRILGEVFDDMAPGLDICEELKKPGGLRVLAISDFGTLGLGGNTRADLVSSDGAPTHFIDLVRNLGRRTDREFSGGTYGFGKAAAFWASRIKTVAIHSKFKIGDEVRSRFIVTALGQQFASAEDVPRQCTGRHWWGKLSGDPQIAEPIEGADADAMAALFQKFDLRQSSETGTTLFIIAPGLSNLEPQPAMHRISAVLRYYFWPKLVDGPNGTPTMKFEVLYEGVELPQKSIALDDELQMFSNAFRAAQRGTDANVKVTERFANKPKRQLIGKTAFVRELTQTVLDPIPTAEEGDDQLPLVEFERPLRHIALMREPHFVVRYEIGPPTPLNLAEYAGVFLTDSSQDRVFAKAEPPTHDDWVPDLLSDTLEKSAVVAAKRRVKDALEDMVAPEEIEAPTYVPGALAEFSRMLGGLIPSIEPPGRRALKGDGAGENIGGAGMGGAGGGGGGRGNSGARPPADLTVIAQRLVLRSGQRALEIRFSITASEGAVCRVSSHPKVRLLEGMEGEPPDGALAPITLAWTDAGGDAIAESVSQCELAANSDYFAYIGLPADTAVSVGLEVEEVMRENG